MSWGEQLRARDAGHRAAPAQDRIVMPHERAAVNAGARDGRSAGGPARARGSER